MVTKAKNAANLIKENQLKMKQEFENSILHKDQVRCSLLQCVAVCCSLVQSVAVCCSLLQSVAVCCSLLQSIAVYCSQLQSVALVSECACLLEGINSQNSALFSICHVLQLKAAFSEFFIIQCGFIPRCQ